MLCSHFFEPQQTQRLIGVKCSFPQLLLLLCTQIWPNMCSSIVPNHTPRTTSFDKHNHVVQSFFWTTTNPTTTNRCGPLMFGEGSWPGSVKVCAFYPPHVAGSNSSILCHAIQKFAVKWITKVLNRTLKGLVYLVAICTKCVKKLIIA